MTALLCGRPTVKGRPCRRRLIPFGPHWLCPVHLKPRTANTVLSRATATESAPSRRVS
jgi:hypothetical protein